MSELDPELLTLLRQAGVDHEPTAADEERVRASLYPALGISASSGEGTSADHVAPHSVGPLAATKAVLGPTLKAAAGLSLAALGAWGALHARPSAVEPADPPAPYVAPSHSRAQIGYVASGEPEAQVAASVEQTTARSDGASADSDVPAAALPVRAPSRQRARERGLGQAVHADGQGAGAQVTIASGPGTVTLEPAATASAPERAAPAPDARGELELIRAALTALNAHQPERARALLEQHRAAHPRGLLREERDGLHAIALCEGSRRDEGARAAESFARASPHSPLLARLARACAGERER